MPRKPRSVPSPLDLVGDLPTSSEDAAAAALAKLWTARRTGRARRPDTLYEAARAHLAKRERRQRQDDAVTTRLLDKVREGAPPPAPAPAVVQQTLALRAVVGAPAAARFVVANPRRTPASVRFRPGELVTASGDAWWPPLRLDPARPTIAPGAEATIRLGLDLSDCPWPAGTHATLELDVHVADALAMKLWVEVDLVAG